MGTRVEIKRSAERAAVDLAELVATDWLGVWPGYSQADPMAWTRQFGWRLDFVDRMGALSVVMASGAELCVNPDQGPGSPHRVVDASVSCWRSESETGQDNPTLFVDADQAWSDYLSAARQVSGEPAVVTAWDDPQFPTSLYSVTNEIRHRHRRPYQLAAWYAPEAQILLYLTPDRNATTNDRAGAIRMTLLVRRAGGES